MNSRRRPFCPTIVGYIEIAGDWQTVSRAPRAAGMVGSVTFVIQVIVHMWVDGRYTPKSSTLPSAIEIAAKGRSPSNPHGPTILSLSLQS